MKVKDYATVMGMHPESVRRLIRQGEIPAMQHGREWLIDDVFVNQKLYEATKTPVSLDANMKSLIAEYEKKMYLQMVRFYRKIMEYQLDADLQNPNFYEITESHIYKSTGIKAVLNEIEHIQVVINQLKRYENEDLEAEIKETQKLLRNAAETRTQDK